MILKTVLHQKHVDQINYTFNILYFLTKLKIAENKTFNLKFRILDEIIYYGMRTLNKINGGYILCMLMDILN